MESTKMNETLIANHALPTTMNETLNANSALQATGMKDDDGFLSTLDVRKEMLSFSLQLGLLHRLCLLSLSSGSNECIFSLSSSSSVVSIKHTNKRKENKFQFNSTTEGTKKRTMTTRKVIQYLYGNADLSDRIGTTITCILILSLISTTIMDGE